MNKKLAHAATLIFCAVASGGGAWQDKNMAVEVGDVVEWERGDNDVIDTVVCSTDAECRTGRCRLIDAGNEIVFAEDIPEAFAAVDERRIATEMKAAPACDSECVDANRIPSVRAPPLALCDIDYAK